MVLRANQGYWNHYFRGLLSMAWPWTLLFWKSLVWNQNSHIPFLQSLPHVPCAWFQIHCLLLFCQFNVHWWEAIKLNKAKMLQLISPEVKILQGFEYSSKLSQIYLLNFCWGFWRCRLNKSNSGRTQIRLETPSNTESGNWKAGSPPSKCLPSGLKILPSISNFLS